MSTVLITGANRGLGLEFAKQYAADSWDVIAACRDPANANELQALIKQSKNVRVEALEVSDQKSIEALADKLKNTSIDVLLNNAGIYSGSKKEVSAETGDNTQSFGSIDPEAWMKVMHVNTVSPIMMIQSFLPHLAQAKDSKVVNITSKMGSIELMGQGSIAYRASKAALNAAMRNILPELSAKKITVVNFHPGWVRTDMGGRGADITPQASITGMRKVIANLSLKNSGQFLDYTGKTLPW